MFPATPVNVEVGDVGDEIVPPIPDVIVHNPVPKVGVFAASDVLVCPHLIWSRPAFEPVGFLGNETTTVSREVPQLVVAIDHTKV